jgi:hypothetical protein
MILISHRGNIKGRNISRENTEDYIQEAIALGYDVEIDVWIVDKVFYLGHDKPENKVRLDFLLADGLWIHCKNLEALKYFTGTNVNCFWHQNDDFTVTSHRHTWAYPHMLVYEDCINVLPELNKLKKNDLKLAKGICSDFIEEFK